MEKNYIKIPAWVLIIILCISVAGVIFSVFSEYKFRKFKAESADRISELEQQYRLEYSTLSSELESSRLHAIELERLISSIQSGVSELAELNQQSSESIKYLQSSNSVIGAVFKEYSRRMSEVTEQLNKLTGIAEENRETE